MLRKSDYQEERVEKTIAAIPDAVRTILDVGCNRGYVTNRIDGASVVVGIDLNRSALTEARCLKACGDARRLPVKDRSADLVMLTECLEHLDDAGLALACAEAGRVARRYLLVSVPWRQNLDIAMMRCRCGHRFHAYGHIQRFSEKRLRNLFQNFSLVMVTYAGERRPAISIATRFRQYGGRYAAFDGARCDVCGNTTFPPSPRNGWTVAARLIEMMVSAVPISVPIWMLAVYERTNFGKAH